ncbi:MAG: hypothetical protein Q8R24_08830 [Legionellaceae bacterium]|nr:hypothetical protein [Legionellaceae bacterium]
METVASSVINELVESNRSQVSWTERHEAFFMSFCPKSKSHISCASKEASTVNPLENRPAMTKIYNIILTYLIHNKDAFLSKDSVYPYQLFGQYAADPKQLADKIFAWPNYSYANFVRTIIEQSVPQKKKLALYYAAAKEIGHNWPYRYIIQWQKNPGLLFTGPSHGGGPSKFLLAYTSLRHYFPDPSLNHYRSSVTKDNGPATQFLFTTLTDALRNNPELWKDTDTLFGRHINNPDALSNYIITHANQRYAWNITVMLWDIMGYDTASRLLDQVADEAFASRKNPLFLRIWETLLMVIAGPGCIEFDHLGPQFGQVEIYDYLETPQLSTQEKTEMKTMKSHYQTFYSKLQHPIQLGYFLFYLMKPFFFITSIMALAILWSKKCSLSIPIALMLPYGISVFIYGSLFTALPRYTDPTLLLPMIITCLALPECLKIWVDRKQERQMSLYIQPINMSS